MELLKPKISIVIPVKNGISTLAECLKGIQKQTVYDKCEIIILDSGSTDGSLELLKNYKTRIINIVPETFNHGATRNLGVNAAKGEYIVMTVQDAAATDEYWLEKMLRHFKDRDVAGVCGQQIVPARKGINPHLWFRPQSSPSFTIYHFQNSEDFHKLSPLEKRNCCGWDDVNAMYRKSDLMKIPFEPVMFGEDMIWAQQALLEKKKIIYDSSCKVAHYHHHSPEYTYKRTLISWLFIYKTFGFLRPNPYSFRDYIAVFYRNVKWRLHPKWIPFNWSLLWSTQKAIFDFKKAVNSNRLNDLEEQFSLDIPQGKTSKL